ncbi:hypothetical protein [Halarchaeum nitratireducens]|uniref:Uncharacterized protein n=1 Tax=Halarchaeum nitratireducens TaxID=489913 RepID=A0A830GFR1_9EURY|nr:hypothetical protein [Halarchaeum nitratireducens]GGN24386.1 hypothetical protein GCM10009021_27750 [Halarchaeum nitratireducens]
MADPSTNTPFDTDSDVSSTTPLYSPVTTTTIYHTVVDLSYPTEYVPIVACVAAAPHRKRPPSIPSSYPQEASAYW